MSRRDATSQGQLFCFQERLLHAGAPIRVEFDPAVRHEFIVLAYGTSPYLDSCVASLKRQNPPVSIRIATSTPNEHVLRIARQHDLEVLANPTPGGGITADWNFGLSLASADLFTLAHQDDLYEPTYSEAMTAAMARHPDALIGFSDSQEMDSEGLPRESLNDKVKRLLVKRAFGNREVIVRESDKRRLLSLGNPVCCPPSSSTGRTWASSGSGRASEATSTGMPGCSCLPNRARLSTARRHSSSGATIH